MEVDLQEALVILKMMRHWYLNQEQITLCCRILDYFETEAEIQEYQSLRRGVPCVEG